MVNTGHSNQEFPYAILLILRRLSAPIVAVLSLHAVMWAYSIDMRDPYQALIIIVSLLALILFPSRNQKDNVTNQFWSTALSMISRWCLLFGILLVLGYATKTSSIFSRKTLFTWFLLAPPLLILAQYGVDYCITRILLSADNARRVVVAGANELGQNLASKIQSSPQLGMKVDGFFDDRSLDRLANGSNIPVLGTLQDLPEYIRTHRIERIFVVLPMRNIQRVTDLLDKLHDSTASIYFVPDVFVFDLIQCRTGDIGGVPIVALRETPFQGTQGVIKRCSDYFLASIILVMLSPLLIFITLAIKFTSPGSVIFKQRRYGLDGREIIVYKFRSMTVSEDSDVVTQATQDDDRVTKVGAILRKYSLDELPQFINVLQGRMSVVGPRPHAVVHNEEYRPLIKGYMVRHKVNPGITGLAQIMGYRGETATVESMKKRVDYDLEYLRNWSLTLDLRIILKTVRIVLTDKMAY
jgi:putative colanic acid biosynthesis UDP-glucose lipid carrier transferase